MSRVLRSSKRDIRCYSEKITFNISLLVKNTLLLQPYLLWVATWDNVGLDCEVTTPKTFAQTADRYFKENILKTYEYEHLYQGNKQFPIRINEYMIKHGLELSSRLLLQKFPKSKIWGDFQEHFRAILEKRCLDRIKFPLNLNHMTFRSTI